MVKGHTLGLMETNIKGNGMGKDMVKEPTHLEKVNGKGTSMKANGRMDIDMVKEHTLSLMEESMMGITRMGKNMVKEHGLQLTERSILGNGRMERIMVREHSLILKEISFRGIQGETLERKMVRQKRKYSL